jgi:hypothetical protein
MCVSAWLVQELDLEQLELLRQDHDTDRNSMNAITDLMAFLSAKAEGGVKVGLGVTKPELLLLL